MLTAETARERTRHLNLSAGCGIPRPIEDRLRDVACDLLRVQAETLEWFWNKSGHDLTKAIHDTRAELKKLEERGAKQTKG